MQEIDVLIVESNAELLLCLAAFLSALEGIHKIKKAFNGVEALQILANEKVDLLITGIIMPVMDGFMMLHHIQNMCTKSRPKIIVISSLGREDFKKRAFDLGVSRYFVKPANPKAILKCIYDLFDLG